MYITIYRGTKEIGGTLIELVYENTRILVDAGYPLFLNGLPIDDEVAGYSSEKLLEIGVLPQINGLYKWDTLGFDAVIISHAHIDHYGLLKYVNPGIPVHMSSGTKKLIEISQLFGITDKFDLQIFEFAMYKSFTIGEFVIKPYLMDHSAFDAAAFEISAGGKTVIYSGDFRGHGRKAVCLDRFISGVSKKADALLIEGTMMSRSSERVMTEQELEDTVVDEVRDFNAPVLFQCSSQNIDRLVSFYKASLRLKRTFVVDVYTANVLYELRMLGNNLPYPSDKYKNIKVFYPWWLTQRIFDEIGEIYASRFRPYRITREKINDIQGSVIMAGRPSMKRDLMSCELRDGLFIYSLWEGYRRSDYQQEFEKYLSDVGFKSEHIHTSGHATVGDINRVIKEIRSKVVVPIHTLEPESFLNISEQVVIHKDNVSFSI